MKLVFFDVCTYYFFLIYTLNCFWHIIKGYNFTFSFEGFISLSRRWDRPPTSQSNPLGKKHFIKKFVVFPWQRWKHRTDIAFRVIVPGNNKSLPRCAGLEQNIYETADGRAHLLRYLSTSLRPEHLHAGINFLFALGGHHPDLSVASLRDINLV